MASLGLRGLHKSPNASCGVEAILLDWANEAHREPGVAIVVVVRGSQIVRREAHAVSVVHIRCVGRRRPVAGVGASIVDRIPFPAACSGQEHTAFSGKNPPLVKSTLGTPIAVAVDGTPRSGLAAGYGNAIGKQNHTIHTGSVGIDGGMGVAGIRGAVDGAAASASVEEYCHSSVVSVRQPLLAVLPPL